MLAFSGCTDRITDTAVPELTEAKTPNILLIVADDLGYTDLGAYGGEIPTPNLDAIANAGIRFTNFHTHALCQQTRAMLMSGMGSVAALKLNPPRPDGERAHELSLNVATLPELLRDAGYKTYMSGKWDLGLSKDTTPSVRGFDRSFALLEASASHFAEPFWSDTSYYQEDGRPLGLDQLGNDFYSSRGYTDKFLAYLKHHDGSSPWFGYLAYTAPHWPLHVPDEWADRHAGKYDQGYDELRVSRVSRASELGVIPPGAMIETYQSTARSWASLTSDEQRRNARAQEIYASMVEYMDHEIGRIVKHLDESGQLNQTVILFMSDHGASPADFGLVDNLSGLPPHFDRRMESSNNELSNMGLLGSFVDRGRGFAEAATAPLRHYKGTLSEGGIRAPAFLHYPKVGRQKRIDNTFFTAMDVLPTFLELAGQTHPGVGEYNGRQVQPIAGRSFWKIITGEADFVHSSEDAVGWSLRGRGALIQGDYKITNQALDGRRSAQDSIIWQLYDLKTDPGETNDLAREHPERAAEMTAEWRRNWQ